MEKLDKFIGNLDQCVKCGACRSGCPTFAAVRREGASARGRLSVVSAHIEAQVGFSDKYSEHIKNCTLCGSCASICPVGVNTPKIVLAARAESAKEGGLTLGSSLFFKHILNSKRLGPMSMKVASKVQGLINVKGDDEKGPAKGFMSRFILPYLGDGRPPPPLAKEFFLDSKEARLVRSLSGKEKKSDAVRVAFFAGCGINYMLPDVGKSTLRILAEHGADVVVPQEQTCCGMPALSMGDTQTAKKLAIKNIEAFEALDVDFITTSCATCTYALKTKFTELLEDEGLEMRSRLESFVSSVRDITELLEGEFKVEASKEKKDEVVTYHDPCHLSRGQSIKDAPRDLLAKSGLKFKELKNPCRCCGLGGGLGYTNYKLSMDIARDKAKNIVDSKADIVATAC
ncbi:MAG: (Fe-S)-binding protein, partial [Proteobacteria bacterium]|nr:(Fe-S)-binding protein [Pseudomonadota bacterium]